MRRDLESVELAGESSAEVGAGAAIRMAAEWERAGRRSMAGERKEARARTVINSIMEHAVQEPVTFQEVEDWLNGWLSHERLSGNPATVQKFAPVIRRFSGRAPPAPAPRSTKSGVFETGIKVIDVPVPLERGGQAVLPTEMIHNLIGHQKGVSIFCGIEARSGEEDLLFSESRCRLRQNLTLSHETSDAGSQSHQRADQ